MLIISAIFVGALNNTNPKLLHEYPNNLIIYAVHVLIPFLWIASLAIWFFTKNSELKKAGKIWLKNIYDDFFSPVLLQWRLYKRSIKYANTGIELSSFQKAIERTIPPDVFAYDHGLQTHSVQIPNYLLPKS